MYILRGKRWVGFELRNDESEACVYTPREEGDKTRPASANVNVSFVISDLGSVVPDRAYR